MKFMAVRWTLVGLASLLIVIQAYTRIVYRERLPQDHSAFTNTQVEQSRERSTRSQLVVLFHGMGGHPLDDVRAAIHQALPHADLLVPQYSTSGLTNENPLNVVREFLAAIDSATKSKPYDEITLVGYSAGALLARKVVVCAYTACDEDYHGIEQVRPWRSRINRLVLLAGMNRGWTTHCEKVVAVEQAQGVGYDNDCRAANMHWWQWSLAELAQRFGPMFGVGSFILALHQGEPFVANLRLEWLALERATQAPAVVQLLGDIDEVVSRSDNLDQFVSARFTFFQLKRTDHASVMEMSGPEGAERREKFIAALSLPVEDLRAANELPPNPDYSPDSSVTHVVMIVHGIRDDGRWAQDLGREFQKADPGVRAFSRSYGRFSALYFLMPTRMEANVRWLVDQYTQLRALYPQAAFSFVGHSNGTYMLSQALAQYHAVDFKRVVFAGSVVPTGFPWTRFKTRVEAIRNYRASDDLVVATLPSVFEHISGLLQVGAAGHAGFTDDFARATESRHFALGGHSAVLGHPEDYSAIVRYVLAKDPCNPAVSDCLEYELPAQWRTEKQTVRAELLYRFSVVVWFLAILVIGAASYGASRIVRPNRPRRDKTAYFIRSVVAGLAVVVAVLIVLRYV